MKKGGLKYKQSKRKREQKNETKENVDRDRREKKDGLMEEGEKRGGKEMIRRKKKHTRKKESAQKGRSKKREKEGGGKNYEQTNKATMRINDFTNKQLCNN